MGDVPEAGTWVRLIRRDRNGWSPKGKWHRVEGWDGRRLSLGCTTRDRTITWALGGAGEYAVEGADRQPPRDVCAHCLHGRDYLTSVDIVPGVPRDV